MSLEFLRPGLLTLSPGTLLLVVWAFSATVAGGYVSLQGRRARVRQRHLQGLLDSIPDLTWIKDKDSRFLLVNRQFSKVFGRSVNSLIGKTDLDITPRKKALGYLADDQTVMRENRILKTEEKIAGTDGSDAWAETIKVPVISVLGEVIGTAGMARDITERKVAESRIRFLAHHDYLTGLNNRLRLEQRCEAFLAKATSETRSALVFIDLDNFKVINDSLGHRVGDAVLKALARRLEKAVGPDEWVARFGGDEFAVFVPHVADDRTLATLVDTLLTNVRQPVESDTLRFNITASLGVCRYPQDADSFEGIARCADLAMYQAKQQGLDRACFYEASLGDRSMFRMTIRQALQNALAGNEFFLEYQPKLDCWQGRVVGLEALVRWQHPELGLLGPGEFIALAEQTGQIIDLGDWVLKQALEQIAYWQKHGGSPRVSVNLSALQLHQRGLDQRVSQLLAEYGVSGNQLEFELTESILMESGNQVDQCLASLRQLGIVISIDDFGTGYSSLAYLSRLPIDVLKIDRSFVTFVDERTDQQAITRAIIQLASALKLEVIAEGIEREEERCFFLEQNVNLMQGFYFSRPVTPEKLEGMELWKNR